jgi:hypothetical protein
MPSLYGLVIALQQTRFFTGFELIHNLRILPMIQIGECSFPTKKAAATYVQEILERAKHAHKQMVMGGDDRFMREYLKRHARYAEIADCGIAYFWAENRNEGWGFALWRTDGSQHHFSWKDCLCPPQPFSKVSGICRDLIMDQKNEFRDRNFKGVCMREGCGKKIRRCHVDHIPPRTFEALVNGWAKSVHMKIDEIAIIPGNGYKVRSRFADPFLAQQWVEYHEINARLRCVCRDCNLSIIRKTSPRNLVRQ